MNKILNIKSLAFLLICTIGFMSCQKDYAVEGFTPSPPPPPTGGGTPPPTGGGNTPTNNVGC